MTTGEANLTLFSSEGIYKLIVKRLGCAEGMELVWGLPYLDDEGCMCLDVAFSDENDPRSWGRSPLAVRQQRLADKVRGLLSEVVEF